LTRNFERNIGVKSERETNVGDRNVKELNRAIKNMTFVVCSIWKIS